MGMALGAIGLFFCSIGLLVISLQLLFSFKLNQQSFFKFKMKFKQYDFPTMLLSWFCFCTGGFGMMVCIDALIRSF